MTMKIIEENNSALLCFEVGEVLPDELNAVAARRNWTCGWVSGIGAVANVRLAYYDLQQRKYLPIKVEGIVELTSLNGNLSLLDGKPFWHLHATVARRDGTIAGGHVLHLETAITVECWIGRTDWQVVRGPDDFSGLNLLKL